MSDRILHLDSILVNGIAQPGALRGGVLVSDPPKDVPWRLHLTTTRVIEWEEGDHYDLEVVTREGPIARGRASLEQTDGQAHMFFGIEAIEIVSPDL